MLVLGAVHAVDVANRDFQSSVFIDRSLIVATAEVLEIQRCIIQLDLKCGERQARVHLHLDFRCAKIGRLLNMKLKLGTQGHQEKDQEIDEEKGDNIEENHIARFLFFTRIRISLLLVGHRTPFQYNWSVFFLILTFTGEAGKSAFRRNFSALGVVMRGKRVIMELTMREDLRFAAWHFVLLRQNGGNI